MDRASCSSRAADRRGTSPWTRRREWAPAPRCGRGFSFRAASPPSGALRARVLHRIDDEADTGEEQRDRQELPHRRAAPQEAELRVRLAEEFRERPRAGIE